MCSLPYALSEPEGLNLRVIYIGGLCNAHNRLLLADSPAQHLVLGYFSLFIGGSSLLDYSR